jgi:hypothetical protein
VNANSDLAGTRRTRVWQVDQLQGVQSDRSIDPDRFHDALSTPEYFLNWAVCSTDR